MPGAVSDTLHAKNTLRPVQSFPAVIRYIHIHRTHFLTFAAGNTLVLIAFDTQQRKITHWFQKYSNRTDILAESSVILKCKSQDYS